MILPGQIDRLGYVRQGLQGIFCAGRGNGKDIFGDLLYLRFGKASVTAIGIQ